MKDNNTVENMEEVMKGVFKRFSEVANDEQ